MSTRARKARGAAISVALGVLLVALMTGEARGSPGWSWPVKGPVLTRYSNDESNPYAAGAHRGIDIAAPVGTDVHTTRAGEVTYAGPLGYSGLTVAVRTRDGYATSYLHLSAIAVRRGESVAGGARLGAVGTTGRRSALAPHLHFGVRLAREEHHYIDPLTLLPPPAGATRAVPAAPAPAVAPAVSHPAPVRAARPPARSPVPQLQPALPDRGRPLALAGLALLVLALLGRGALDRANAANRALSARAHAAIHRAADALRTTPRGVALSPGSPRPRSRRESAGRADR